MKKRSLQKSQSRELILTMAYELFSERGILGTSTQAISDKAGLSHGSIFAHFENRDALVLALVDRFGVQLKKALVEAVAGSQNVKEVLKAHLKVLESVEDFYTSLVVSGPFLSREIQATIFALQSGLASFLKPFLKEESLPLFLNAWIGLIHYYLIHRDKFALGPSVLKEQGDSLIEFILTTLPSHQEEKMEQKCTSCGSCGMPLLNPEDHAKGDPRSDLCTHCVHEDGTPKSYEEVLSGTADYFIQSQGITKAAAIKLTAEMLSKLPHWKRR